MPLLTRHCRILITMTICALLISTTVQANQDEYILSLKPLGPTDSWAKRAIWSQSQKQYDRTKYPFMATALAYDYDGTRSRVYTHHKNKAVVMGDIYYGDTVAASKPVKGPGCKDGTWYQIHTDAYICSADGFKVAKKPQILPARFGRPKRAQALPYNYVKAKKGVPLLKRIPNAQEFEQLHDAMRTRPKLDIILKWLDGLYFIAYDKQERAHGKTYLHTVEDRYIQLDHVNPIPISKMHGEQLQGNKQLPIAFVFKEDRPVYQEADNGMEKIGLAEKHARFHVEKLKNIDGTAYVFDEDENALQLDHVRVAVDTQKPAGVPAGGRWLHINLGQQTLVAYEDDKPVFVTLVSSGIKGRDTPTGFYQLQRGYVSKTMRGPDKDHGTYEVGEVPWTFYYYGTYAVHGAYWHNVFGETRSHGCTNIPPVDARWIFSWLSDELPYNWHSRVFLSKGWTYFTNDKEAYIERLKQKVNES